MSKSENQKLNHAQTEPSRQFSFSLGVAYITASNAVSIILLFLEMMIAVRILSEANYGIYVLIIAITNFLIMLLDCGCKTSVIQLIASSNREKQIQIINSTFVFRIFLVVLSMALILIGKNLFNIFDSSNNIAQYAVYLPLMLLSASTDELFLSMLQGLQIFKHIAISGIIRSILRLALSIIFLTVFKLGLFALLYSWIISFAVSAVYQYLVLPVPKKFMFNKNIVKQVLRFGLPLQISRFLWLLSGRINVFLLATMAGPASVAFFGVGERVPFALWRFSGSFLKVYFPRMSTLLAEKDNKKAEWIFDHSLRLISFAGALAALISVLFSHEITVLLFTEKYAESSLVFAILMIAYHMTFIVTLMGYTLTAAGYPVRSLFENGSRTVITILANVFLIPIHGFLGAAYATLFAYYISNPLSIWLLKRSNIQVRISGFTKQTLIMWFCIMLFWLLPTNGLFFKLFAIAIFFISNIVLSTISREDLTLILPKSLSTKLGILKTS